MKEEMKGKIAIYSRKSKFTGKGESIENQIEECKKHIAYKYQITDMNQFLIYEDEGFSGKDTKRPQFQKMLKACRNHEIDMIVCYRLDRISRNTIDFALLYKELERLDINFISVTENFDTTTPLGRAMLSISSAFAQLERDTIAERIRDNMLGLAKTGRWLGGTTPLGYTSIEIKTAVNIEGKVRTAYRLKTDKDTFTLAALIFDKFLEFHSLTKLETYLLNHHYKTRNGKDFSRSGIRSILENPVYASADENTFRYFHELGTIIYNKQTEFNGTRGLMVYNKTDQADGISHKKHAYSEWIVAIGKHKPLLPGEKWLEVQDLLEQNKSKSYRKPKNNTALLSGLLFCSDCGSYMRPKTNRRLDRNGNKCFSYLCETKEKSHGQLCTNNRPDGNLLDELVCDEIKKIAQRENFHSFSKQLKSVKKKLFSKESSKSTESDHLRKTLADTDKKIENLVLSLSQTAESPAFTYISRQITVLHEEKLKIEKEIKTQNVLLENQNLLLSDFDVLTAGLSSFSESFDMMSIEEKRTTLRILLDKVIWDGTDAHLYLSGFGEPDKVRQADRTMEKGTAREGVANEVLMHLRARKKTSREVSLYEPIGTDREGNEIQLFDIIETEEDDAHRKVELSDDIQTLYNKVEAELSSRERLVLKMRYGLYNEEEYTQREIAALLGISRSYVSRIEKSAIEKLREYF